MQMTAKSYTTVSIRAPKSPVPLPRQKRNTILSIVTIFAVVALLVTTYGFPPTVSRALAEDNMASAHQSSLPLSVSLSPSPSPASEEGLVISLIVTVENTGTSPVSILTWNSPLDPRLSALGLLKFMSVSTGKVASGIDLKINHRVPENGLFTPEDDCIVRIEGGRSVEREVKVKEMEISLVKGEKYRVRLEGWWGTVWVGEGELRAGEGRMGDFKSEGIEVQVPE